MGTVRLPGIAQSPAARGIVADVVAGAAPAERASVLELFAQTARADGNTFLGAGEARLVKDAFDAARGPNGLDLGAAQASVAQALEARLRARDASGIRGFFTSTTPNINELVVNELRSTVAAAKGRPVDFNIMIFSFVDPTLGDAILDIAQNNPNVTFRLIADFGQLGDTGNRQPPRLVKRAAELGLDNIQVKYKKDAPFVWDARTRRPVYDHNATKGLNHHKGLVALIDGQVHKLITGSYNWSPTADDKNYEDLFVVDATNVANRPLMAAYQAEFTAFYNHPDALNTAQAKRHKLELYNALRAEHNVAPYALGAVPEPSAPYVPRAPGVHVDVNDASDAATEKLRALVGDSRVYRAIVSQYANRGRFESLDDLYERVPSARRLPEAKREALAAALEFGDGRVVLATASADELVRALKLPRNVALGVVAKRAEVGDFESIEQLRALPGMTAALFDRIGPRLDDTVARAYFSARPFGAPEPARGWAAENANRRVPVMGLDGVVAVQDATLSAGVRDLFQRAKPGDVARVAMYGMSQNTPEFATIVDAVNRGVAVKVLLNDDFNDGVAQVLANLARQGKPIEVRIQKARTMHQKFGVLNDDLFFGTANMSGSSATKHSEDRFVVKNDPPLSRALTDEFELIWGRSRPV